MNKSPEDQHHVFLKRAIELARSGMIANEGGPFGALVVKDGQIISEGNNQVLKNNDPTAHAEINVIRKACKKLNTYQLTGCIIYTSCEPCPMCLGAIYWARPEAVYFASSREDASTADFDDQFIYEEINKEPGHRTIPFYKIEMNRALDLFNEWIEKDDKKLY